MRLPVIILVIVALGLGFAAGNYFNAGCDLCAGVGQDGARRDDYTDAEHVVF